MENHICSLQERDAVIGVLLHLLIPARCGEGRWVTPRVVVESKEITALIIGTAVHVGGHLVAIGINISSRVTDRDRSVALASNILLHVTSDSLDIRSSIGSVIRVDHFVTREEKQGVGVFGKSINGGEDILKVDVVVGFSGLGAVNSVLGCVDIQSKVNASFSKSIHASIVVSRIIDSVNANSVDSKLLKLRNITIAASFVSNGVGDLRRAT